MDTARYGASLTVCLAFKNHNVVAVSVFQHRRSRRELFLGKRVAVLLSTVCTNKIGAYLQKVHFFPTCYLLPHVLNLTF